MCKINNLKIYVNKLLRRALVLCRRKEAVMSVEAAAIVPLFLISVTLLMSIASVFYINEKIEAAVNEEAKIIAVKNYDESGYGASGIQAEIISRLGNRFLNSGMIKGGESGLDFSDTDVTDREIIEISVKYIIAFPFDIFGVLELPFEKKVIMHSWSGYEHGLLRMGDYEYVYMTTAGTVYHRNRNCSHIRLQIRRVSGSEINGLRNNSGSRYRSCEACHPEIGDPRLYITLDGDRYHNTLTCSGLIRNVIRVRLSEIRGVPPCSRCGY